MQRTPPFPFLPDLETPLRDAMRGVANFAEATEDALEPAAQLLPEPLRAGFQKAIRSIETQGKQLVNRPLRHDQIIAAAGFATGQANDAATVKDFAKVVGHAWEHLQHATGTERYLISETVLASVCARVGTSETGAKKAAGLVGAIRASSAIGRMPGIADGIEVCDRAKRDAALVAIMVWLLAARADTLAEEVPLLDLALALVAAIDGDVAASVEDPAKMADLLRNSAAHL